MIPIMKQFLKNAPWKRLVWAIWLPIYVAVYFIVEDFIPADQSGLWYTQFAFEQNIPFCAPMIVFYISWFALIFGVGLNLWYFHEAAFKRYMITLAVCFYLCVVIWLIVPNACDLRREADLAGSNIFTLLVGAIRRADTPTNVFPSEHVIGALAAILGYIDCGRFRRHKRRGILMCVWAGLIIVSTVLVKQHALIDLPAGALLTLLAAAFIYRRRLKEKA